MIGATALAAAIGAALLYVAWLDRQRRAWAVVTIAGVVLYLALRAVPWLTPGARVLGAYWNWSGHLLALGGMLLLAAAFARRAGLGPRALGFVRPAALGAAAAVAAAALLLNFTLNAALGLGPYKASGETWLFLATMPGLAEEVAFRGVLLAAAERAAPATGRIAGIALSRGAVLLTLAFVALHGLTVGTLTSVLPASLLYLWLRLKTGSVIVPIVAHNLWNLTVLAAYLRE